jgi:hypothetical protein
MNYHQCYANFLRLLKSPSVAEINHLENRLTCLLQEAEFDESISEPEWNDLNQRVTLLFELLNVLTDSLIFPNTHAENFLNLADGKKFKFVLSDGSVHIFNCTETMDMESTDFHNNEKATNQTASDSK